MLSKTVCKELLQLPRSQLGVEVKLLQPGCEARAQETSINPTMIPPRVRRSVASRRPQTRLHLNRASERTIVSLEGVLGADVYERDAPSHRLDLTCLGSRCLSAGAEVSAATTAREKLCRPWISRESCPFLPQTQWLLAGGQLTFVGFFGEFRGCGRDLRP